jgi:hypothetical protein
MSWRAPTETDLQGSVSADELAAYRDAAIGDAENADPIAGQLATVVNLVRGYLRAGSVEMGPDGTLPETLIRPAMDFLTVDVIKRLPIDLSEDRRRARDAALSIFRDVATGKMRVEDFGKPSTASSGAGAQLVSSRPNLTTRRDLDGL